MALDFQHTFNAASSDTDTYVTLTNLFGRGFYQSQSPLQVLGITAWGDQSSGTAATIQVVVMDKASNTVIWYEDGEITPAANRTTDSAGSGAEFIGEVVFTTTGRNTVDMLMCADVSTLVAKVGITAMGAYSTLTVAGVGSSVT